MPPCPPEVYAYEYGSSFGQMLFVRLPVTDVGETESHWVKDQCLYHWAVAAAAAKSVETCPS